MPSKQIKEFTPAATISNPTDKFIFQSHTGFTQMIEVGSIFSGFGYTHLLDAHTLSTSVKITTAKLGVTFFQDDSYPMELELHANQGDTGPDIWKVRADSIGDADAQGTMRLQSYATGAFTDIVTLKSHKTTDASASSVEIKDLLKTPALQIDGGKIAYTTASSQLKFTYEASLTLQTGVPFCGVEWLPDDELLQFTGNPGTDAGTHILFSENSFVGLGGVHGDNYLTTQVYDSGGGVMKPTGVTYSGARAYPNAVDLQILNRDEGNGTASLSLTQDHGQNAGDTMQLEYRQLDSGGGASSTSALVLWTDHNDKGSPADPVLVVSGNAFHASRGVGIHGNLHVSKETRMYDNNVNFAGHMVGGRVGAAKYTGFKAPSSFGGGVSSHVYEMPGDFPVSDKVLQSNTSGELTWVTLPSTGTGTVEAGTQNKVAYYPNVDQTLVNDTSALYWKNDRLGVNQASPQKDVHLKSTSGPTIRLERNEPAEIVDGDVLGIIEFYGFDDAADDLEGVGAKIVAEASGNWIYNAGHANDTQAELQFWTTPDAAAPLAKRMVIEDSGVIYHSGATYTDIEDNGTVGGETINLDLDASDLHKLVLDGNLTLTFSNEKAGQRFLVRVLQSSGGGYTITWPGGITWVNGVVGQPTTTDAKATIFGFIATSVSTFDGFVVGKNIG